jgi:3-methyladenine DNA glycosylase AlkD
MLSLDEIREDLKKLSEGNQEYAFFNKKIVNTKKEVLGVRTPDLRKFAKSLARNLEDSTKQLEKYISELDRDVYEEILLAGLLINVSKISDQDKINLSEQYLDLAGSWAEIDIFAMKKSGKNWDKDLYWHFATESLTSSQEFTTRFGIIFLMSNFLNEEYISKVFEELQKTWSREEYYVKMALAWTYATTAINFFDKTIEEVENLPDSWTRRKSYTKMLESFRITPERKLKIRELRSKIPK